MACAQAFLQMFSCCITKLNDYELKKKNFHKMFISGKASLFYFDCRQKHKKLLKVTKLRLKNV